jgi:hypothetical protein
MHWHVRVLRAVLMVAGTAGVTLSGSAAVASSSTSGPVASIERLLPSGTVRLGSLHVVTAPPSAGTQPGFAPDLDAFIHRNQTAPVHTSSTVGVPTPDNSPVVVNQAHNGFDGISHLDQRLAGGGNQFSSEPPDQGLCAGTVHGTTYLFESVNSALNLYDANAHQLLLGPITVSQFYGLPPAINRTTGRFGPFVSDPKCYFDTATHRWFHSILVISLDPATGAFVSPAYTLLAVSDTSNPLGTYHRYKIPATSPNKTNCPCFGDQPLIGADKYGFYVNTSEYPIGAGHANFAQIYAIDKLALEAGTATTLVHFSNLGTDTASIQPATSPAGHFATGTGGTEYFMAGFDCIPPDCAVRPTPDNRVTVWALTNTSSLATATPALSLTSKTLDSESYMSPPPQKQRQGTLVFGADPTENPDGKASLVDTNDTRMNQVVYADGKLWSAINTEVNPGGRTGIAYFILDPSVANGSVDATIAKQGYIAASNANVSFPSVGVNQAGLGVVAFSLMGPTIYPSAAYQLIGTGGTSGPINVARVGFRPEDGFTCYENPVTGLPDPTSTCRWGDYSASFALPDGSVWSAAEYIGDGPRTTFANWSTFVWPIVR